MITVDPITFEIVRHRLFRAVDEAILTLKHVSGSPITNEAHDLMVSLYTAEGDLLMGGVGFLHHMSCASEACKAIIRRFKGRISDGDMFLLNDPYTAALHTSDVYIVSPIHFEGELVAWSACFVHVSDIGAMNPGGFCPDARDIFTEGFSSPGIRIIERGQVCEDVFDTFLNMVRAPELVALDIRSMIACNHVARERIQALFAKYTAATVAHIGVTLITQSEALLRARLLELPDGHWTARQFMDVEGDLHEIRLAMTKRADALVFDFTGSSPQSSRGVNCTRWGSWGGLLAPLYPLLCHDITWNEGVMKPVGMVVPETSIVNASRPAPVSIATVGAIQAVNDVSLICLSKMLAASEKYAAEATAVWQGSNLCIHLFGRNHRNQEVIGSTTDTFAGSGGARWAADGIDLGGEIPNPISRMANVETNEAMYPIRYLFRRRMRDSGGAGEFRGGTGGEYAMTPHDSPIGEMGFVVSGKGVDFPMSHGLSGGYPGGPARYIICRGAQEPGKPSAAIPLSLEEIGGRREASSFGVYHVREEDIFYVNWNGAGGVRDPLDRDPAAVLRDFAEGLVSESAARNLYGVLLSEGGLDADATRSLRSSMRADRGSASHLQIVGRACKHCGAGKDGATFKIRQRPLRDLDRSYTTAANAVLAELICAGCGALLDSEVTKVGALPLFDEMTIEPSICREQPDDGCAGAENGQCPANGTPVAATAWENPKRPA
jgi:N-methylhydantoinase B